MAKRLYIDFEYNKSAHPRFNLVCAAFYREADGDIDYSGAIWLLNDENKKAQLKSFLKWHRDNGFEIVAFNVVAEASSFIALNLDPTKFKWIDLQIEWKMLINHNHKWAYGKQLIEGKKRRTEPPRPKYEMTEEELKRMDNSKPSRSLTGAVYKLLGEDLNAEHKDKMRDIILTEDNALIEANRKEIIEYCKSDASILIPLREALHRALMSTEAAYHNAIKEEDKYIRGDAAARAALITQTGYPVDPTAVKNFARAVPNILGDLAVDINRQFPDPPIFVWNKSRGAYTMKQKPQRDFIKSQGEGVTKNWLLTDKGKLSLSLLAWTKAYSFSHNYPEGNFPAQVIRYLKTKQNLNGFLPKPARGSKDRRTFFDFYGPDGRARAWLNPYGSQSSRFQPAATGFISLKSAWMRSMIVPPKGFSICGIDYGSEEFLLAALLSGDQRMYEAYKSGDPYFYLAKLAKAVPEDAKKEDYPIERLRFKSTTLGISYLMGKYSLARKLTSDTGKIHTPEDAENLIQLFFEVYSDYDQWIKKTQDDYRANGYLRLLDGWIMFGDNPNTRSVSNCPIQGAGGCILRKAIQLCQSRGLNVIIPLHDALYIEYPTDRPEQIDILYASMHEAFCYYFEGKDRIKAADIRLDIDVWGPDLKDGSITTPMGREAKSQTIYIDPRAKREYELFSKYFKA